MLGTPNSSSGRPFAAYYASWPSSLAPFPTSFLSWNHGYSPVFTKLSNSRTTGLKDEVTGSINPLWKTLCWDDTCNFWEGAVRYESILWDQKKSYCRYYPANFQKIKIPQPMHKSNFHDFSLKFTSWVAFSSPWDQSLPPCHSTTWGWWFIPCRTWFVPTTTCPPLNGWL